MYIKQSELLGKTFGQLVVVELLPTRRGQGTRKILCQCSCGESVITTSIILNRGDRISCGCAKKRRTEHAHFFLSNGKTLSSWWNNAKKGAKRYNRVFELTKEETWELLTKPCFYCGYDETTVGIDRVDNTQGYIYSNCVPCCKTCNFMKYSLTQEKFLSQVDRINQHQKKVS